MDLRGIEWSGMDWTGLNWLSIGTSGGLLWTWEWTFRFHEMLGSSWVATLLAAFQEGLSSMKLVSYVQSYKEVLRKKLAFQQLSGINEEYKIRYHI
jgi:hypothetical protein